MVLKASLLFTNYCRVDIKVGREGGERGEEEKKGR